MASYSEQIKRFKRSTSYIADQAEGLPFFTGLIRQLLDEAKLVALTGQQVPSASWRVLGERLSYLQGSRNIVFHTHPIHLLVTCQKIERLGGQLQQLTMERDMFIALREVAR